MQVCPVCYFTFSFGRNSVGLRTGRKAETDQALLPGKRGGGPGRYRKGRCTGQSQVEKAVLSSFNLLHPICQSPYTHLWHILREGIKYLNIQTVNVSAKEVALHLLLQQ